LGKPFHDVGHVGFHRFLKRFEPLHEGRIGCSQSGTEDLVDIRGFDLDHQSQGIFHGAYLINGSLGGIHLLLQPGQIVLPGVEKVGLPATTECSGPAYFQQVGMVLFLVGQTVKERWLWKRLRMGRRRKDSLSRRVMPSAFTLHGLWSVEGFLSLSS